MDYNSISKQLRQYSQDLIAYKMGAEFADACNDAADAIYRFSAELERATKENHRLQELAHSQRNGLEQLRGELEQVKRERADIKNELCYKCGNYEQAHNGWCDHCRWKEK